MAKPTTKPEPLTLPAQISADEVAYLKALIDARQQSDKTLQAFTTYLAQKYQFGYGDSLTPDGAILRKEKTGD